MAIVIQLNDVGFADEMPDLPDGGKILVFHDAESGIQVIIPLAAKAAETVGKQLLGRIKIARQMPGLSDIRDVDPPFRR